MQTAPVPVALSPAAHAAIAQARADWPDFSVEEQSFLGYVQARQREGEDFEAAVQALHLSDLYCACACAAGSPRALAAFEQRYLAAASGAVLQLDSDPAFLAEVKQKLRHKILLAEGDRPPRIAEYAGRGPLHSWVRAALLRLALNHKRDHKRDRCATAAPLDDTSLILADPELGFIKSEYRDLFKQALQAAFAALERRERSILRLYVLDGLNIERIGVIYNVHRATIARWIAQARQKLEEQTRQRLATQVGLAEVELDAGVGLVLSQIDLSLSRLLQDSSAG